MRTPRRHKTKPTRKNRPVEFTAKTVELGGVPRETQKIPEDKFKDMYGSKGDLSVLSPPYNRDYLVEIPPNSSVLPECIQMKHTGVCGFGYMITSIRGDTKTNSVDKVATEKEKDELEFLFKGVNPAISWQELSSWMIQDIETTGDAFLEVIRTTGGEHCGFEHLLPQDMRLCQQDESAMQWDTFVRVGTSVRKKVFMHRFRRYCMKVNEKTVYFKEWGCPKNVHKETGEYGENFGANNASEVFHLCKYDPSTYPYGMPGYIGQLDNIIGCQDAEMVNRMFFRNRGMPLLITVSGGELGEGTYERITQFLQEKRDRDTADSFYSCLVLEARNPESDWVPGDKPHPSSIDIKPFAPFEDDAMFHQYVTRARSEITESFRINTILLGRGGDVSQASALVAAKVVEQWTFNPMRVWFDWRINMFLEREHEARFCLYRTKGPDLADYDETTTALSKIMGAVTPNDLRELAGKILGKELSPLDFDGANDPVMLIANSAGLAALQRHNPQSNKEAQKLVKKVAEADGKADFVAALEDYLGGTSDEHDETTKIDS